MVLLFSPETMVKNFGSLFLRKPMLNCMEVIKVFVEVFLTRL